MTWREYQASQKVLELGDRFLSYVDQGAGDPVVLLHGIPTWGYLWHALIPNLASSHRVLVPDLLGFGYSDKRDAFDRSIAVQSEVLNTWLEHLGIEQASWVAHDIGGGAALRIAAFHPQRVSRLCLMNTVCYDSWPIEAMLQIGHPDTYRNVSASTLLSTLKQALKSGFAESPDRQLLDSLLVPYATEVGKLSLIRNASALNTNLTAELTPRLSQIDMPTLIIWGEDDVFQPVYYGEWLAWDLPNARLVRISNARHFVMLDQPQVVVEHISNFLTMVTPPIREREPEIPGPEQPAGRSLAT